MDSFEINKILGALLGTCLVLLAVHLASGTIFAPPVAAKPGYIIQVKQEQPAASSAKAAPAEQPIENLLATASVKEGADTAKECEVCHNLGKGQGAKIGPDLYGVVGRPIASQPGFNYSSALKAKAKGAHWTFDLLNVWLTNPQADVPGTLMTFAGIPSEKQRANVIAYLNSNSDHPLPLPKAAQSKPTPPAGAKPTASAAGTPPSGGTPANTTKAPATPPAGAKPTASAAGTPPSGGTPANTTKAPATPPATSPTPPASPAPAPAPAPSAPAK
jgi:cytochrome c